MTSEATDIKTKERGLTTALWTALMVTGCAAVAIFFWPCTGAAECRGGTPRGLILGVIGLLSISFTMLYLIRKDNPRMRFMPLEQWLFAHSVVGVISLFAIVGHSGFRSQNVVAALALLFLALTVISGAAGLFIFHFLPLRQVRHEATVLVPDDLCRHLTTLSEDIIELVGDRTDVFRDVYEELVKPLYRTRIGKVPLSADVTPWADRVDPAEMEDFMALASKIEEVHDTITLLGKNMRFRWWARVWLLFHVPSTIGLLVFTIVHIISVGWYVGR